MNDIVLAVATSEAWLPLALANFDAVLSDHAHCEKKAAANALSLLQAYPEIPALPAAMARLAREESAHLAKVLQIMEKRGLRLGKDEGDPYAQALLKQMRTPTHQRRVDRFLVAGIIEARSHERLALLAEGLQDPSLKRFYGELAKSEDGHQRLFLRFAREVAEEVEVSARLTHFIALEAEMIRSLPIRAAIH